MSIDPEDNCIDLEESKFIEDTIEREVKNYKPKERKSIESIESSDTNDKSKPVESVLTNHPEEVRLQGNSSRQKDPRLRKTMKKKAEQPVLTAQVTKPLGCLPPVEVDRPCKNTQSWGQPKTPVKSTSQANAKGPRTRRTAA